MSVPASCCCCVSAVFCCHSPEHREGGYCQLGANDPTSHVTLYPSQFEMNEYRPEGGPMKFYLQQALLSKQLTRPRDTNDHLTKITNQKYMLADRSSGVLLALLAADNSAGDTDTTSRSPVPMFCLVSLIEDSGNLEPPLPPTFLTTCRALLSRSKEFDVLSIQEGDLAPFSEAKFDGCYAEERHREAAKFITSGRFTDTNCFDLVQQGTGPARVRKPLTMESKTGRPNSSRGGNNSSGSNTNSAIVISDSSSGGRSSSSRRNTAPVVTGGCSSGGGRGAWADFDILAQQPPPQSNSTLALGTYKGQKATQQAGAAVTQEAATVAKLQAQLEAAVEMRQMQQDHSAAMDAVRQEQLADTRSEIERSREASAKVSSLFLRQGRENSQNILEAVGVKRKHEPGVPKGGLIDNINHIKEQLGLSGSLCVAQTLEAAAGELGLKQLTGTAMEKASRILDELGC
jgi:hypothetical protein